MKRLVLHGPGDVRVESWPESPPPTGDQVSVRSTFGLISSGTERRLYLGQPVPEIVSSGFKELLDVDAPAPPAFGRYGVSGPNQPVLPAYPTSLGYNTIGIVEAVGPGVMAVRPGDRVMSTGPHKERLVLPESQVVVVPAEVPSEQAVCSYLATLGLHALRRIGFQPGENVVVMGLGVVGMAAALVASACGARVIGLDPDPNRRERARNTGRLLAALDPGAEGFPDELASAVAPEPVDHVIETAGNPAALRDAIRIVRHRGRVAILALYANGVPSDALGDLFHAKECSLVSCANDPSASAEEGANRFTVAGNVRFILGMLAAGRLDFGGLVSHTFPIDDAAIAYQKMAANDSPFLGLGLVW